METSKYLSDDEIWAEYRDTQLAEGRPAHTLRRGEYLAGVHYADARMQRFDAFSKIHTDLQLVSVKQQSMLEQARLEIQELREHVHRLLVFIGKES